MADNEDQDKTEEATPYKLEEARKKGQVSKSVEINTFLQLLIFTSLILALAPGILDDLVDEFEKIFVMSGQFVFTIDNVFNWFFEVILKIIAIIIPIFLINLVVGVVATMIQTKPIITTHPLKPDFKKINPVTGFKKLFSIKTLFELLKAILKIIAVISIIYIGFNSIVPKLFTLMSSSPSSIPTIILSILSSIGFLVVLFLLPIAILDYLFTKREFSKKMRMSRREVKDEYKKREGHPEVRAKRKELHKELVTKTSALSKVKDSDFIITNPTHISVALFYDVATMNAPIIIAKGSGELANKIKILGKKYNKPVLRKPSLARLLYKKTNIGSPIPEDTFNEIAPLYNWLRTEKQ